MDALRVRTVLLAGLTACSLLDFAPAKAAYSPPPNVSAASQIANQQSSSYVDEPAALTAIVPTTAASQAIALAGLAFGSAPRNAQGTRALAPSKLRKEPPIAISKRLYRRLAQYRLRHPRMLNRYPARHFPSSQIALFVTDDSGVIWELDANNNVLGELTDCSGAEGAKVDTYGNLWAACTNSSTINMYAPNATSATLTLNDTVGGVAYYAADVAVDGVGDVYATNLISNSGSGNVVVWAASSVSNGAMPSGVVNDPNVSEGYFLDTDLVGNVYVDYTNSGCGFGGLDQIVSPLSSTPQVTTLVSACSGAIQFPGGVYTSNLETQLNVLDQDAQTITQFPLVGNSVANPTGTLGPASSSGCDPVSMGWNQADSQIAIADAACLAVDYGAVSSNSWTQVGNADFALPISAAYVVSDKFQPQSIGADHLLVMQALDENYSAVLKRAGPRPTPQKVLAAMLQVPSIPQGTKDIITDVILAPQAPLGQTCQAAVSKLAAGFPQSNYNAVLNYLKKQATLPSSCLQLHAAIESAISIATEGRTTIYNPKWLKAHYNSGGQSETTLQGASPDSKFWKGVLRTLLGDAIGALGGCTGGPGGIVSGAVAGSIAVWIPN